MAAARLGGGVEGPRLRSVGSGWAKSIDPEAMGAVGAVSYAAVKRKISRDVENHPISGPDVAKGLALQDAEKVSGGGAGSSAVTQG